MAEDYTQTYKIDYQKTFALVTKMNIGEFCFHQLSTLTSNYNILMYEMSFYIEIQKNKCIWIFFHVLMEKHERIRYAKLKNARYKLKQSSKTWFNKFTRVMIDLEFKQTQIDHTVNQTLRDRGSYSSSSIH